MRSHTVYSVQCTVYSVQCILYSVQRTVCNAHAHNGTKMHAQVRMHAYAVIRLIEYMCVRRCARIVVGMSVRTHARAGAYAHIIYQVRVFVPGREGYMCAYAYAYSYSYMCAHMGAHVRSYHRTDTCAHMGAHTTHPRSHAHMGAHPFEHVRAHGCAYAYACAYSCAISCGCTCICAHKHLQVRACACTPRVNVCMGASAGCAYAIAYSVECRV